MCVSGTSSGCQAMCRDAVCPVDWCWPPKTGFVSNVSSSLLGRCCRLRLQVTSSFTTLSCSVWCFRTPVTPESKEFQCFPGFYLKQFPHPMKPGVGRSLSARILPSLSPMCSQAAAGHTATDRITPLLSHNRDQSCSVLSELRFNLCVCK